MRFPSNPVVHQVLTISIAILSSALVVACITLTILIAKTSENDYVNEWVLRGL